MWGLNFVKFYKNCKILLKKLIKIGDSQQIKENSQFFAIKLTILSVCGIFLSLQKVALEIRNKKSPVT